jgi:hypothetical protein
LGDPVEVVGYTKLIDRLQYRIAREAGQENVPNVMNANEILQARPAAVQKHRIGAKPGPLGRQLQLEKAADRFV